MDITDLRLQTTTILNFRTIEVVYLETRKSCRPARRRQPPVAGPAPAGPSPDDVSPGPPGRHVLARRDRAGTAPGTGGGHPRLPARCRPCRSRPAGHGV